MAVRTDSRANSSLTLRVSISSPPGQAVNRPHFSRGRALIPDSFEWLAHQSPAMRKSTTTERKLLATDHGHYVLAAQIRGCYFPLP